MKQKQIVAVACLSTFLMMLLWCGPVLAAPSADLWPRWQKNDGASVQMVDHSPWNSLLGKYVRVEPAGINRFNYSGISGDDRRALDAYLQQMQEVVVSQLNRGEQKAFWINLYNALTVKVILDHYPVGSIMDVDISPGFFSNGPWGAKLIRLEGEKLSLNDIEHRILRPIFKDNRVHYALNCASLGCPNLQPVAFTVKNMDGLLSDGAIAYINHPRGAQLRSGKLRVSSIYKWFQADFGGNEKQVVAHLLLYAKGDLLDEIQTYQGRLKFDYDWNLNE